MNTRAHDQALKQVRSICLALPEASEVEAWGHATFLAGKKMFVVFGREGNDLSLRLKVGFERQEELLKDDRFFLTPYAAHQRWVSPRIDGKTDWEEVGNLAREA